MGRDRSPRGPGDEWNDLAARVRVGPGSGWRDCLRSPRGSQGSMHVTLAEMPNIWAMEPEETTFRSQTGPPPSVEGWIYQPTYKTFDQNLVLSKRNAGEKDRAETEGVADREPIP